MDSSYGFFKEAMSSYLLDHKAHVFYNLHRQGDTIEYAEFETFYEKLRDELSCFPKPKFPDLNEYNKSEANKSEAI